MKKPGRSVAAPLLLGGMAALLLGCTTTTPTGEPAWISTGRWVWDERPESWNRPDDQLQFSSAELTIALRDSFELRWSYSSKNPGKECRGEEQRGRWGQEGNGRELLLVSMEMREWCDPPRSWDERYFRESVRLRNVTAVRFEGCWEGCESNANWLTFRKER